MAALSPGDRWRWDFCAEFGRLDLNFYSDYRGPHFRARFVSSWEVSLEMRALP